MNKELMYVPFQGEDVLLVEHEGQPYVPAKRICEAIGVDWARQSVKLAQARWSCCRIATTAADGKRYEMLCLPLAKLAGWLMTISPEKVRAEVKPKLLAYQDECTGALRDYWDKGRAENPRFSQNGHASDKKHGQTIYSDEPVVVLAMSEYADLQEERAELWMFKAKALEARTQMPVRMEEPARIGKSLRAEFLRLNEEGQTVNQIGKTYPRFSNSAIQRSIQMARKDRGRDAQ